MGVRRSDVRLASWRSLCIGIVVLIVIPHGSFKLGFYLDA